MRFEQADSNIAGGFHIVKYNLRDWPARNDRIKNIIFGRQKCFHSCETSLRSFDQFHDVVFGAVLLLVELRNLARTPLACVPPRSSSVDRRAVPLKPASDLYQAI